MLNDTTITDALRTVQDPELHRDIVSLDMVKEIHVDGEAVALKIDLTTPACPLKDQIEADVAEKKACGIDVIGPECAVPLDAPYRNMKRLADAVKAQRHP